MYNEYPLAFSRTYLFIVHLPPHLLTPPISRFVPYITFHHIPPSLRLDPTNWAAQNNRTLCRLKQHNWLGAEADATAVLEPQNALLRE